MLTLAVAAILALRRRIDTPVTYVTRAARAEVVLPALGKLAGVDLQASKETANEILVISVKDTPLADILPRIATITEGEWVSHGQTMRLDPNRSVRNEEERAMEKANYDLARKAIGQHKAIDADLDPTKVPDFPEGKFLVEEGHLEDILMAKIASELDPAVVATASTENRLVFSTDPTPMQHALGSNAAAALADFVSAHNSYVAKSPPPPLPNDPTYVEFPEHKASLEVRRATIGPCGKANLVHEGGLYAPPADGSDLYLYLYDRAGKVIFEIDDQLIYTVDPSPTPVDLIAEEEQRKIYQYQMPADSDSGGFYSRLSQPLKFDPLSFFPSDCALQYTELTGKPLVADLPDGWASPFRPQQWSETDTRLTIEHPSTLRNVPDSEFVVLMPDAPMNSRSHRLDRAALNDLIRSVKKNGLATLDAQADFCRLNPDQSWSSLVQAMRSLIPGGLDYDHGFLAFYGELSPHQRERLRQGEVLRIRDLASSIRVSLSQLVYGSWNVLEGSQEGDGGIGNYTTEPSEVAPNGLPPEGTIELTAEEEPFAMTYRPRNGYLTPYEFLLTPEGFTDRRWARDHPSRDVAPPGPLSTRLRLGTTTYLTLTIRLGPKSVIRQSLVDHHLGEGPDVTESTLPADFELRIKNLIDKRGKAEQGVINPVVP